MTSSKTQAAPLAQALMGTHVCLVEDDRTTARVYTKWLERMGAKVTCCATVREFSDLLEGTGGWTEQPAQAPKVLITDLVLPDGDGRDVITTWRKSFLHNQVIVVTAFASVDNAVDCMRKGAFDFLRKPMQEDELVLTLNRALEHSDILVENENLSSAVRVLSMAQTLSGISNKEQLLKTLGRLLHREFNTEECYVFAYHANRNHLQYLLDLHAPGISRQSPELIASTYLSAIIEKRPPPPENFSDLEMNQHAGPKKTEFQKANCQIYELGSPTGNSAFLVFLQSESTKPAAVQKQFYPVFVQAQRTFQNIDLAAALSFIDELTGLYNQRFLDVALNNEMTRAHRYQTAFTVVFIDLDKFKSVNDTFGHIVGSAVLRGASRLLRTCMRDADQLLRYGGDEFVAILPNTDEEGGLKVAERIRRSFEENTFDVAKESGVDEATDLHCTTSIGLACYPSSAQEPRDILQLADNAMYMSKRSGRNQVTLAIPSSDEMRSSHRDGALSSTKPQAS